MIKNADFSRYRAAEFIQFLNNVLLIMEVRDAVELQVSAQVTALETALGTLDAEYKRQTSSLITATLAELDERRDKALTGILRVVSGYELHFEPAKQDAARRIGLVIGKYGAGVTRLRYQQETGDIRSLLQDLQNDPAAPAALTTLGLTAWIAELNQANQAFDSAYVQRAQETAGDSSQLLALRGVAVEKWETLAAHLTAHATLTGGANFKMTIAELNSLITDYNNATTTRTPADPAPEPTPAPTP